MNRILRLFLPILVVGAGAAVAVTLVKMKPSAERKPRPEKVPVVEVIQAEVVATPPQIRASGVVSPAREVTVSPQVSGKVVWQNGALVPGGRVRGGTTLLKIDPRDFELAVERERSRVQAATLELQLEEGRKSVANREWEILGEGRPEAAAPLALRGPQLENAKRQVEVAELQVRQAELNLERTQLRAPFDALVLSERVEVGQVVAPGATVATLIGTEAFWVTASVPVDQIGWVRLPNAAGEAGSPARVMQQATRSMFRSGNVVRLLGTIDSETRTAQVIIEVRDPLDGDGPPLLPGAFVDVMIEGGAAAPTVALPRAALVDGASVWIVDDQDRLQPRRVSVAWGDGTYVYVDEGLVAGERIVTSPVAMPVRGMRVEVKGRPAEVTAATPG